MQYCRTEFWDCPSSCRNVKLGGGDIPSQNPIENVNSKAPDLESKQRFSEDSEWSTLGALKMP